MLPRQERLRLQKDFEKLRQHGRRYHQPALSLVVLEEDHDQRLAGFIVSKRISKKAVERNLIKRRLRAAYCSIQSQLLSGYVLLFIAKPLLLDLSYQDLEQQMGHLLSKARVCK